MKTSNSKQLLLTALFLFGFIFTETVFAITRDEIINTAENYKNHLWTAGEWNVCHNKVVWRKDKKVRIDTPDKNCGSACFNLK